MPPGESRPIAENSPAQAGPGKLAVALIVIGVVLTLDILTKMWVVRNLAMHHPVPILGDFFRLTYTHNPGAAFGINIGENSRLFFLVLSIVALGVLAVIYRSTPAANRLRTFALALVSGGALGNILDRIRFEAGVVDFLDVGFDFYRWPVFNVADSAVSIGAVLLLISFYLEGRHERPEETQEA